MITKANVTVLDLGSKINTYGQFEELSVVNDPQALRDVVNRGWAEANFVNLSGDSDISNGHLLLWGPSEPAVCINKNKGDIEAAPTICINGPGYVHAEGELYIGSKEKGVHFVFGSDKIGETTEAICIHEDKIESNIGALILRSPDVPGSPDPSPYILLEPQAPGDPQSVGGSKAPAIVLSNPDQAAHAYPYQYTKIANRDGTILQVEGDNDFGVGTPVTDGTPVFAIKQNVGVFFDFFMHVLKRVGEPVDPDDAATKRYVDEFGGSIFTSSSFGPTGYVVFQGGLIMQWGAAPDAPLGVATITLPVTWNTGFMVGFCAAEVSGGDSKIGSIVSAGPSQVKITYNGTASPVTPVAGSWIALGY